MPIGKDIVIEKLRAALRGAIGEVKNDPDFAPKVLQTICTELGFDPVAAMYISSKLKVALQRKAE